MVPRPRAGLMSVGRGNLRDTTSGALLIRVLAETAQHAGHADIVRELIDGRANQDHDDVGDSRWWASYLTRVQQAADAFRP